MDDGDDDEDEDIVELPPVIPEVNDDLGVLLEFRRPSKVEEPKLEQRVFVRRKRSWKWSKDEVEIGFSIRHDSDGGSIGLAFENPGKAGIYEVWLPTASVSSRNYEVRLNMLSRLQRVLGSAKETADRVRRQAAKREVIAEAVGIGGSWKLVRGSLPREGKKDEVWWEVTGGGYPMRIHEHSFNAERSARRDFDGHKPPYRCGAYRSGSDCKHGWSMAVDGAPCIRRASHPGEHRSDGEGWSTWPRLSIRVSKLFGT